MKTCDICKKFTTYLEDLPYCSVCSDCAVEISEDGDILNSIFEQDDENRPSDK